MIWYARVRRGRIEPDAAYAAKKEGNMRFDLRLIRFLDEAGVWIILSALFLAVLFLGQKLKDGRLKAVLFVGFLMATVLCELILQQVQRRKWEFVLVGTEFLTVSACLGFGFAAVLGMVRKRKGS